MDIPGVLPATRSTSPCELANNIGRSKHASCRPILKPSSDPWQTRPRTYYVISDEEYMHEHRSLFRSAATTSPLFGAPGPPYVHHLLALIHLCIVQLPRHCQDTRPGLRLCPRIAGSAPPVTILYPSPTLLSATDSAIQFRLPFFTLAFLETPPPPLSVVPEDARYRIPRTLDPVHPHGSTGRE